MLTMEIRKCGYFETAGITTYPGNLAYYMNPNSNSLGAGVYTYFPSNNSAGNNVTIALITPGPHITLAPFNISYG